jgi:hypothetical protein
MAASGDVYSFGGFENGDFFAGPVENAALGMIDLLI